jgi:hypothetical protein
MGGGPAPPLWHYAGEVPFDPFTVPASLLFFSMVTSTSMPVFHFRRLVFGQRQGTETKEQ